MKNLLLLLLLISTNFALAQEKVEMMDLYLEGDLTYKVSNNDLFTGKAQHLRRNGHLVYEEYYKEGQLVKYVYYYNRTEPPLPATITELYSGTNIIQKVTILGQRKATKLVEYYDESGKKKFEEEFENDQLTYSCEYQKGKKHGLEYCIKKDGTELRFTYNNGKKIKPN